MNVFQSKSNYLVEWVRSLIEIVYQTWLTSIEVGNTVIIYLLTGRWSIKILIEKKEQGQTCKRFGLLTSNLALVLMEVVVNGPANRTEFWTIKLSESIVWDISSTVSNGSSPLESNGNNPAKDVYLRNHKSNHEFISCRTTTTHCHYR